MILLCSAAIMSLSNAPKFCHHLFQNFQHRNDPLDMYATTTPKGIDGVYCVYCVYFLCITHSLVCIHISIHLI